MLKSVGEQLQYDTPGLHFIYPNDIQKPVVSRVTAILAIFLILACNKNWKNDEASWTEEETRISDLIASHFVKNWTRSAIQFLLIHHRSYLQLILTWGEKIFTTRGFFPSRWNSKKNVETSWLISCSVMLVQGNSITLPCQKRLTYINIQALFIIQVFTVLLAMSWTNNNHCGIINKWLIGSSAYSLTRQWHIHHHCWCDMDMLNGWPNGKWIIIRIL